MQRATMQQTSVFTTVDLENRLGQPVQLGVSHHATDGRDYVFITALSQQASSFVGKNAEHFAFQLCARLQLEPRRLELVELKSAEDEYPLWRWRFEWVGKSPLSGRGEPITSASQQTMLLGLLNSGASVRAAAAR